ncbi:YbaK/EbsC family protein [Candidatus Uhrbacteria bacterium]|nr:YbaK/EbsC family protein [Candidatus Uhrbacteria bacterium]
MSISKKIKKLLDDNKISYKAIKHKTVYTAHDMASTMKARLDDVLKTVVIKTDKDHIMVVVPASFLLDLKKLAKVLKAKKVQIAQEGVMKELFKVEPGNIAPFAIHEVPILADKAVAKMKKVLARAGSYEDSVELKAKDWLAVAGATMADIGKKMAKAASKAAAKQRKSGKTGKPKAKSASKAKKSKPKNKKR